MARSVMFGMFGAVIFNTVLMSSVAAQSYSATYLPGDVPATTEEGQSGTNQCGTESSQNSTCQNVYINSVTDFCLFAPPKVGHVGDLERVTVSYCMRSGYGTRLIPDGTIEGAHFVQTPDYVQITGKGDLTKINIAPGDAGGEMDPHGADGNGNPIGGLVFGSSYGALQQYHEWTNFMGASQFCLRACVDSGKTPRKYCQHIYDVLGCDWNMPGNYSNGIFEDCRGDSTFPMGLYTTAAANGTVLTSTFRQGQPETPRPHTPAPSSSCQFVSTISNQPAVSASVTLYPSSVMASMSRHSAASASSASRASASLITNASASSTPTSSSSSSAAPKALLGNSAAIFLSVVSAVAGMVHILV